MESSSEIPAGSERGLAVALAAPRRREAYEELLARLSSLETFQRQLRECENPAQAFEIAADHVRRIVPFEKLGFWIVDPETRDFVQAHVHPAAEEASLLALVKTEIEAGTFAWALQQTRSILVRGGHGDAKEAPPLLLSGLATRARTVGMFIGVLPPDRVRLAENSRELLSLVFLGLTYTLENFQLLGELKVYNEHLQDLVQLRTSEIIKKNADLKREAADRRRAETALQRSENRYRAVVLALDDGVVILNLGGRVVGSNPSAARVLGVTEEALRRIVRFEARWRWVGEDGAPIAGADLPFATTLKTGRAELGRVLGLVADGGAVRWLQVNTQPLREEGEAFHNGVVVSFADITEKREVQENLLQSEERLRHALDAAEDGLWDWDVRTDRLVWNRRYLSMLGHDPLGPEPTLSSWRRLVHPDDLPMLEAALDLHFRGESPVYEAEYRMRTAAGGWKWVLDRGRAVSRDERGWPLRLVGLHQDTTERRQAEERLREAKAAAESADRAKGEFLAMMSHELRTPMNGIIGFSNLLAGTPLTLEQRDYVQLVAVSSKQLLSLLNDLLDFSKIEAGQLVLERHVFSVRHLLDEVVDLTAGQVREKGLTLSVQVDETLPDLIVGDSIRLRQILLNLLGNAVKFTEEGGIVLRLRARPPEEGGGAAPRFWWSVEDTGIGIPAEKQAALFKPFIQADSSTTRKYGGTGLGLAICRRLAETMGGSIWLDPDRRSGSAFHFVTPIEEASPQVLLRLVPEEAAPTAPSAAPAAAKGEFRVLFHDRDPAGLRLARHLFSRLGHAVTAVAESALFVAEAGTGNYDVVLAVCRGAEEPWFPAFAAACRALGSRAPRRVGIASSARRMEALAAAGRAGAVPFPEWAAQPLRLAPLRALLDPAGGGKP